MRGPGRPPPLNNYRRSKGPGQETRRGPSCLKRPYQHPVRGPCEGRAPKSNERGGDASTAEAQAHKHTTDTRRAPKGQPDRACETHRAHGMRYQQARTRHTRTGHPATTIARDAREGQQGGGGQRKAAPAPQSKPAASAAHTPTGHCIRQGGSGAQRHAPPPRLGSLRASSWGSHW